MLFQNPFGGYETRKKNVLKFFSIFFFLPFLSNPAQSGCSLAGSFGASRSASARGSELRLAGMKPHGNSLFLLESIQGKSAIKSSSKGNKWIVKIELQGNERFLMAEITSFYSIRRSNGWIWRTVIKTRTFKSSFTNTLQEKKEFKVNVTSCDFAWLYMTSPDLPVPPISRKGNNWFVKIEKQGNGRLFFFFFQTERISLYSSWRSNDWIRETPIQLPTH